MCLLHHNTLHYNLVARWDNWYTSHSNKFVPVYSIEIRMSQLQNYMNARIGYYSYHRIVPENSVRTFLTDEQHCESHAKELGQMQNPFEQIWF